MNAPTWIWVLVGIVLLLVILDALGTGVAVK